MKRAACCTSSVLWLTLTAKGEAAQAAVLALTVRTLFWSGLICTTGVTGPRVQQRIQAVVERQAADASTFRHRFCSCEGNMATPYQVIGADQTPVWSMRAALAVLLHLVGALQATCV